MHRLLAMQTATLTPEALALPQEGARRWQTDKAGQVAFGATALFAAQLYLSPALWIPFLETLRPAAVLSIVALAALFVRRVLKNEPLWMGWRTALLAVYAGTSLLSPIWSMAPHDSVDGAIEVGKHFLFFLAIVNSFDSPRRVRIALGLYALSAIAPGWGTFDYWRHDIGLVEGFRGRWLASLRARGIRDVLRGVGAACGAHRRCVASAAYGASEDLAGVVPGKRFLNAAHSVDGRTARHRSGAGLPRPLRLA